VCTRGGSSTSRAGGAAPRAPRASGPPSAGVGALRMASRSSSPGSPARAPPRVTCGGAPKKHPQHCSLSVWLPQPRLACARSAAGQAWRCVCDATPALQPDAVWLSQPRLACARSQSIRTYVWYLCTSTVRYLCTDTLPQRRPGVPAHQGLTLRHWTRTYAGMLPSCTSRTAGQQSPGNDERPSQGL